MRVLLDECLPEGLRAELPGHRVLTVREAGLAGKKDGDLLTAASGRFDVFITMDRSLQWQQRVSAFHLGVVIIRARSNSLLSIRPLLPDLLRLLPMVSPGQVVRVGA
jgi:predicted nuclease of predicted toxin-antitoxin system